jgi:hypothetical protein
MVSAACARDAQQLIAVGINLFLGNGCGDDAATLSQALGGRALAVTDGNQIPDVVGFDLSPQQERCSDDADGDVFGAQRKLAQLGGGKPTFQWIEAGPVGECTGRASDPDPTSVRAETWLAIAGGAAGIGYLPASWTEAIGTGLAQTDAEIRELTPALLAQAVDAQATSSVVKVGARTLNGATYVIAVNTTCVPVDTTIAVPGLTATAVGVYDEQREVTTSGGAFADHFEPLAVHVYVAPPSTWTTTTATTPFRDPQLAGSHDSGPGDTTFGAGRVAVTTR